MRARDGISYTALSCAGVAAATAGCFSASSSGGGPQASFDASMDTAFSDNDAGADSSSPPVEAGGDVTVPPVDSGTAVVDSGHDAAPEAGCAPGSVAGFVVPPYVHAQSQAIICQDSEDAWFAQQCFGAGATLETCAAYATSNAADAGPDAAPFITSNGCAACLRDAREQRRGLRPRRGGHHRHAQPRRLHRARRHQRDGPVVRPGRAGRRRLRRLRVQDHLPGDGRRLARRLHRVHAPPPLPARAAPTRSRPRRASRPSSATAAPPPARGCSSGASAAPIPRPRSPSWPCSSARPDRAPAAPRPGPPPSPREGATGAGARGPRLRPWARPAGSPAQASRSRPSQPCRPRGSPSASPPLPPSARRSAASRPAP